RWPPLPAYTPQSPRQKRHYASVPSPHQTHTPQPETHPHDIWDTRTVPETPDDHTAHNERQKDSSQGLQNKSRRTHAIAILHHAVTRDQAITGLRHLTLPGLSA